MPPNLALKKKRHDEELTFELPLVTGPTLVRPPNRFEAEPSPMIEAILAFLEQ